MEKIALRRMGLWYRDAWRIFWSNYADMLPFGFVVFLIMLVQQFMGVPLLCAACAPSLAAVLGIFLAVSAIFLSSSIWSGLCGVATAMLHARPPLGEDFKLDRAVHVQALLAYVGQAVLIGASALAGAIPAIAFFVPAVGQNRPELLLLALPLLLLVCWPAALAGYALGLFATPLVVEKRLDFWSALVQSIDCARRDLAGLMFFSLTFTFLWWASIMFTFGLGLIFFSPFFGILLMRVHVDYFGLDADHWAPTYLDEAMGTAPAELPPVRHERTLPGPPPLPGDDRRPRALPMKGAPAGLWQPRETPPSEAPPTALSSDEVDIPEDKLPPPPPPVG